MSSRRVLARLSSPEVGAREFELVLAERHTARSEYVRFETTCLDPNTGDEGRTRLFVAVRPLRGELLCAATEDLVRRYLSLVVLGSFKGNRRAAVEWILSRFGKELPRGLA